MRDKVTRHCPQTTAFEEKGELKRIPTEVSMLTSLTAGPNRLPKDCLIVAPPLSFSDRVQVWPPAKHVFRPGRRKSVQLCSNSQPVQGCSLVGYNYIGLSWLKQSQRVQELCQSRDGRPGLSVLMSLTVSVDVKQHRTMLRHWSQFVPNMSTDIRGYEALHHHHHKTKFTHSHTANMNLSNDM